MPFPSTVPFDFLRGKTLASVDGASQYSDEITFTCTDGSVFRMRHEQDCCENVSVEEIVGDMQSLIGAPIVEAEEVSNYDGPTLDDSVESYTWTFYKLGTSDGFFVTIRWLGVSNGYYSESVHFETVNAAIEREDL